MPKLFSYTCFGETLVFAESLGWADQYADNDDTDYSCGLADEIEQDALKFIRASGFTITGLDPEVTNE